MGLLSSRWAASCAASRSMSMVDTSALRGQPEIVGGVDRALRVAPGLQHQVERLGPDPAVGVEQHDDAGGERRGDDLADRPADADQDERDRPSPSVDSPTISRIWPTKLNGTVTAPETRPATTTASSRMPNTRQKSFLTSAKDRVIGGHHADALQHDQRRGEAQHRVEVDQQDDQRRQRRTAHRRRMPLPPPTIWPTATTRPTTTAISRTAPTASSAVTAEQRAAAVRGPVARPRRC